MERRASKRLPFNIDAEIVTKDTTLNGYIENVSQEGIEYLITAHVQSPTDFAPNKIIDLNFQIPSGDKFNLKCKVIWYLETEPHDKKLLLGMEIISPPSAYRNLVKNLTC